MFLLLLLAICPSIAFGATYTYNRCNFTAGPSAWADPYCGDTQTKGTPIDLCGAVAFDDNPTMTVMNYDVPRTMDIINNGHTIQVTIQSTDSSRPWLQVGDLSATVGQSTNTTTQTWSLQQMHLHWGRMNHTNEGSEHYMQGMAYAAEAHFVHYNSRFGSFANAVASGSSDALLVVGVFLEYGDSDDSATVTTIGEYYGTAPSTNTAMENQLTLSNLFDGTGDFYSYAGGLTTPGCNEIVTWVVMTETKKISNATLTNYWMIPEVPGSPEEGYISEYGNYRPLQLIGNRTVYNTAGATAACTTVSEPMFNCAAGLTTVAEAQTYITTKYQQTTFTYQAITSMSESSRFSLAFALVYTEIIAVGSAVYSYILVTSSGTMTLPVVANGKGTSSEIMVTDIGSANKAVMQSYAPDSAGFTSMDIPYNRSNAYKFLFSVDRMDNDGNLMNDEPMTFQTEIYGTESGLNVLAFNDEYPNGVDITTWVGSEITYMGNWMWQITVPHTSAIVGYTEGTTSSGTTTNNDGLLGLIALIFLPCIAIPICFWGWKQASKASKAPVGGYEEGAVPTQPYPYAQSYPYGQPTSPMGMNPYYAKPAVDMSYSVPAFAPSYPAPAYP